jgi:branched-chain amino acid transport system permease protein
MQILTRDPIGRRPLVHTSYRSDMALLDTRAKRVVLVVIVLIGLSLPFLLADADLTMLARGSAFAIGAIGLMLLTGFAGQVSLGHAFFAGIGFYTAAVISGDPDDPRRWGLGITEILVWLPAAGLVAAAVGAVIAPLATRLRGLYLAIVTLGLVFVGEHLFDQWRSVTGGGSTGRPPPTVELFGYRLDRDGTVPLELGPISLGPFTRQQQLFWLLFVLLVVFAVAARNLARSDVGRAFTAIRDRDLAASMVGVNLARQKTVAFAVSSFYAGCAGALFYTTVLSVTPEEFGLRLSVLFIVMVLIGGAGTITGAVAGAFLIALLPWLTTEVQPVLLPFISTRAQDIPNVSHVEEVLYGALIIVFLIFEPRGLFGIWHRVRSWWKSYPFSY